MSGNKKLIFTLLEKQSQKENSKYLPYTSPERDKRKLNIFKAFIFCIAIVVRKRAPFKNMSFQNECCTLTYIGIILTVINHMATKSKMVQHSTSALSLSRGCLYYNQVPKKENAIVINSFCLFFKEKNTNCESP